MTRSNTFEVSIEVGGKVEIEGIYPEEDVALDRAEYLLKLAKYTAVKVTKISGRGHHTVIFEKIYTGQGRGATISSVNESFLCESLSDVYTTESRHTLLRLMRGYFDQQLVIPLELLHNYMMLRYLERDTMLFSPAINRLAALQAPQAKVRVNQRYDALAKLFREIVAAAKDADQLRPHATALATKGLTAFVDDVNSTVAASERNRVISYAIAHYLEEARDWGLKLTSACNLFEDEQSDEAAAIFDGVVAEVIDGTEPVRVAIGYAPTLANALESLLAVIKGEWDDRLPGTSALQRLSDVIAQRPLPRVRTALLARIAAALDGKGALTKLDRAANASAFKRLVPQLVEFGGFMGGVAMCSALTRRAKTVLSQGTEDLSFENTVSVMSGFLPHPGGKIGYLLDLLASDLGRKKASHLTEAIAEQFAGIRSIKDFAPDNDASWSQDMVREDFRRRLYQAGIPRRLADGLLAKLGQVSDVPEPIRRPQLSSPPVQPLLPPPAVSVPAVPVAPVAPETPRPRLPVTPAVSVNAEPDIGRVVLTYMGQRIIVEARQTPFVIGRSEASQLTVNTGIASRSHAHIEVADGEFLLVDHSMNGTIIQNNAGQVSTLSNSSAFLLGSGTITVGALAIDSEPVREAVIEYRRVPAGL